MNQRPVKTKKRKPSATRVICYQFGGDIDYERVMRLLKTARDRGTITQFDGNKSMTRGMDVVWFNGSPGRALRDLRAKIAELVR